MGGCVNIPDGEVCTSVVEDSVNGTILYNIPSNYQGFVYNDIRLTFRDGKIVEASANKNGRNAPFMIVRTRIWKASSDTTGEFSTLI